MLEIRRAELKAITSAFSMAGLTGVKRESVMDIRRVDLKESSLGKLMVSQLVHKKVARKAC